MATLRKIGWMAALVAVLVLVPAAFNPWLYIAVTVPLVLLLLTGLLWVLPRTGDPASLFPHRPRVLTPSVVFKVERTPRTPVGSGKDWRDQA